MHIRPILSALLRNKAGLLLIVLQVAITLAVICNSLYIVLDRAQRTGRPSGMDEANTFVFSSLGYAPNFDTKASIRADLDLIRSLPGVVDATTTNTVPMTNGGWGTSVDTSPIVPGDERERPSSALYFVDEHGLDAFGVKLVEGRGFTAADVIDWDPSKPLNMQTVIVTRALADKLYPNGDALGKPLYGLAADSAPVTIVGIIEQLQKPWTGSLSIEQSALVPAYLLGGGHVTYLVRTEPGQRDRVIKEVEERLSASQTGRLLRNTRTMESIRESGYRQDRAMMTILLAVMGSMLLITGLGIVGLASFWVTRRIKQIGTRRALGARRFNIRAYFQTENAIMIAFGVGVGLLLTYGFNQWLMAATTAPRLPWFYVPIGALAVFVLGQIAVLGPAQRASRVSPAVATRTA